MKNKSDLIDGLQKEINDKKSVSGGFSERISRSIIEYADNNWEEMADTLKLTLKQLPIHRTAEEKFVSLITDPDNETDQYRDQFMLQTDDDLKDAPIEFASYVLLQCRDRSTKNFYRSRLQIEIHGRVAVLKDILKQIGIIDDQERNNKLLKYLLAYYPQTIDELRESKDQIDKDGAARFGVQLAKANFIPCLDGSWHNAGACSRVTRVQAKLLEQQWPHKEIPLLIQLLFQGYCIVRLSDSDDVNHFLKKQSIEISEIDPHRLYEQAIISDSAGLSLKARVKLINDDMLSEHPDLDIKPSPGLLEMSAPTLTGEKSLGEIEYLDSYPLTLLLMKHVAPNALDKKTFARQMGLSESRVPKVLSALCINEILSDAIVRRVVHCFPDLWVRCRDKDDKFSILSYLSTKGLDEQLETVASSLDVVLVQDKKETWKKPELVFGPTLMLTEPPFLTEDEKPNSSVSSAIKEVWDNWCGIRNFGEALSVLVEKAKCQKTVQKGVKELYNWIDHVYPSSGSSEEEFKLALRTTLWVLARKDGKEEFTVPGDVIIHKGNNVLQKHFWVPSVALPTKIRGYEKEIGFRTDLEASKENLETVCSCLSEVTEPDTSALLSIYEYVADAIEGNPELGNLWNDLSQRYMVFRFIGTTIAFSMVCSCSSVKLKAKIYHRICFAWAQTRSSPRKHQGYMKRSVYPNILP